MTIKDYKVIAEAIRVSRNAAGEIDSNRLMYNLTGALKTDNPNFDHDRFINATMTSK